MLHFLRFIWRRLLKSIQLFKHNSVLASENDLDFEGSKESKIKMVPQTLSYLSSKGMDIQKPAKIKFLFKGMGETKMKDLKADLQEKGNLIEAEKTELKGEWIVSGWTRPQSLHKRTLQRWVGKMCELGKKHNFIFIGWGVNL